MSSKVLCHAVQVYVRIHNVYMYTEERHNLEVVSIIFSSAEDSNIGTEMVLYMSVCKNEYFETIYNIFKNIQSEQMQNV